MATTVPNYEEAAALAVESISSLDNLPNEVQHILNEINHLEKKCQDLQNDISRDQRRYIRDVIRTSAAGVYPFSPGENGATSAGPAPPAKTHVPPRVATAYAEIDALSAEKIQLAERLIFLLARTQSRLDADVTKGESLEDIRRSGRLEPSLSANISTQVSEHLRNALDGVSASTDPMTVALTPLASASSHGNKKRRLNAQTSIKLTAPPQSAASTTAYARSRPSRQAQATKHSLEEPDDDEMDAEGEEDFEGDEGEEDPTLYCFCQKRSYGDFHISCVGVKPPLPDKWFCPDCIKTKGVPEKRKGRKK
ncbi:hypothetical protein D9611_002756 [Ephemerocybe angulata]|uniref:Inhibitor of growth protein N-terminal histone-binding domain-containing protein n=1 Tax=Ephemerocybe angulata TaxID=980116 RepID=A0A8H5C152_9AGAR|nr:hypothetical protein D9611_002756 [Tulosesus angulatus]